MRTALTTLTAVALLALLAPGAMAAEDAATVKRPHVTARLVADRAAVAPGEAVRVGVIFDLDPHWHIYWKNPGGAGIPTVVDVAAPEGWTVGDLAWPTPAFFQTSSNIKGYGYEGQTLLFRTVTAPASAAEGQAVELSAKVSWLVCEKSCIPGKAKLSLTLPIGKAAATASASAPLFDKAAAQTPQATPAGLDVEALVSVSGVAPGDIFEVAIPVAAAAPDLKAAVTDVAFYPWAPHGLDVVAVTVATDGPFVPPGGAIVRVAGKASDEADATGDRVEGVLRVTLAGKPHNIAVTAKVPRLPAGAKATQSDHPIFAVSTADAGDIPADADADVDAADADAPAQGAGDEPQESFLLMLFFAFLGGMILNIMPCVLPVLSIKVLSVVEQSTEAPARIRRHGYAYTAGVLMSFAALAVPLILFDRGWGSQMQEPLFVAILGAVVFAFALSLFGVFEVQAPGANALNNVVATSHGYRSSFFYGAFAVVLATPCTAPLLAPALGFAATQPPVPRFILLLTVGLGLAFPFLILALVPRWAKWLPKPGAWMLTFKKVMGFLLVATTLWLINTLVYQLTPGSLMGYLGFLTVVSFALWIYGHWATPVRPTGTRWTAIATTLILVVAGGLGLLTLERPKPASARGVVASGVDTGPAVVDGEIQWRDFAQTDIVTLANGGHTVFVDFTAEWCATCKVVEETVVDTDAIRGLLAELNVVPVKADWTNEDPEITKWLRRFKRNGVPMYLVLAPGRGDQPILLPDLLTTERMSQALKQAGPSRAHPPSRSARAPEPGVSSPAPLLPLALRRRPWRAVLLFGIPLIGATVFQAGFNLTEVWVFGQLGDKGTSMAGAAVSDLVTAFFVFIATGLGNAAVANISHAHGAGDLIRERRHVRQALVAGAIVSLGSALLGLFAGPIGWLIMGDTPSREIGSDFLRVMAIGGFGTVFLVITTGILRARGEAMKTMALLAGVSIATLAIESVLVLGLLGLPRYGVIAAAWVTVAMRGLFTVAAIWMIAHKVDLRPPPGERFIVPSALKLHFKQGFESAVQLSIRGVGFLVLVGLAARRLTAVDDGVTFTALNFWIKLDVPTLLFAFGWGGTVGPIVGMSMGAGRAGHGKRAAWWGVLYMTLTSLVTMTIVLVFGRDIVAAFIPDSPAVVDQTVEILSHAAPVYWGIAAGIVIGLAYNGAGDMRTPLKWDLAILLFFQGTMAWVLSDLDVMGAEGLFLTITLTGALSGIVPVWLLRRARWKPPVHAG